MVREFTKKIVLVGAGAAALGAGIAIPAMAWAQDSTPTPSTSASASTADQSTREQQEAARKDKMAELLANELGLSKDQVSSALDKVDSQMQADAKAQRLADEKTRLDAAVKAGTITQAQEDAVLAAEQAGVLGGGPGGHGMGR